ncbi:MAG TPA: hypothetical protein QKA37_01985 [Candidatus Megaira endosymbiont of Stentor roeselii]|nr:hypothetical protein [Candidatus Megaera endosymbiont of Stentor roeselii]
MQNNLSNTNSVTSASQNRLFIQLDKNLTPQTQHIYIASSYFFVLIILGGILIKALYELKSLKNEKKDSN